MFSFLLGLGREFSASSCGKLRPKSVWNKCWKADWFWFARGRRGKAYFLVTARNRKYRVFLEDRERGKRCVMLKQAKVGSKKLRDLSCVDKPLPGGAQGCALLQLRWVWIQGRWSVNYVQGRGEGYGLETSMSGRFKLSNFDLLEEV